MAKMTPTKQETARPHRSSRNRETSQVFLTTQAHQSTAMEADQVNSEAKSVCQECPNFPWAREQLALGGVYPLPQKNDYSYHHALESELPSPFADLDAGARQHLEIHLKKYPHVQALYDLCLKDANAKKKMFADDPLCQTGRRPQFGKFVNEKNKKNAIFEVDRWETDRDNQDYEFLLYVLCPSSSF